MSAPVSWPTVVVVSRRMVRGSRLIDYVGELHLQLLLRLKLFPLIVSVLEDTLACLPQYARQMRGLLLVEGEDVHPKRYPARRENYRYLEKTDPVKDEIELGLLRHALKLSLPILGICRGSQLLNVVNGGVLYGDVRKEKKSPLKHIDYDHYDAYRHRISVQPGSPLERWYKRRKLKVNSYHHQGIRRLAPRFEPMAYADDELIEGFYDPKEKFVVGLQFHPERLKEERAGNWRLWKEFAAAVREGSKE
jgi:gamma-glutamyl-gamma-aminobutyrate hydrolase PuuD